MKFLFFGIQTTGNASWRQPLEDQPYIYQIAYQTGVWKPSFKSVTLDGESPLSQYIRPKAELHPRVQQILKINRDSLNDEPSFDEILPLIANQLKSCDLIIAHDWMRLQGLLENERLRAQQQFPQVTGQSLRMLTKQRADMKTRRNKRLRSATLKELHTKLFKAQRIDLYTADGYVKALIKVFQGLIDHEVIYRDESSSRFTTTHREQGVYYRAW